MRGDPNDPEHIAVFQATPQNVRAALLAVGQFLDHVRTCPESKDDVLISMGEVLNNVVEHAYEDAEGGQIEIHVRSSDDALHIRVSDWGRPMPEGALPEGQLPNQSGDVLSEGGYGWFLIRTLARDLGYRRSGACNVLTFIVPKKQISVG